MKAHTYLLMAAATYVCCCSAAAAVGGGRRVRNRGGGGGSITADNEARVLRKGKYYAVKPRRESPEQLLAIARQHAIQVIVEKMFRALGEDFPQEPNMTMPIGEALPTVANVSSIVADPCPYIYTKCSSESFLSSCSPPNNSNPIIWKKMYNLYFPISDDLFVSDILLNASLQLYKENTLPIDEPTPMVVELYAYTGNATKRREFITSTNVTSDYIGWISLDVTDLIENLISSNNHGFHIKVKEYTGIYWNDLSTFTAMDCTNDTNFIALPLGVRTDQPEPKFPSLNIRTGTPDQPYPELEIDDDASRHYYSNYNYDAGTYIDADEFTPSMDDPNITDELIPSMDDPNIADKFTPSMDDPNVPQQPVTAPNYLFTTAFTVPQIHMPEIHVPEIHVPDIHLPPKKVSKPMAKVATDASADVHYNFVKDSDPVLNFESVEDDYRERGWYHKWWPYSQSESSKKANRQKRHRKYNKRTKKNDYHSLLL